jgi:hypothetical protein
MFMNRYHDWLRGQMLATEPRNRDGVVSPSQAMGCITRAVHQLNGEPMQTLHDPGLEDLFRVATLIHEYFQQRGVDMGVLSDCERVVELPEWRVRGQIDGVLTDPDTGRRALLEIKTVPEWLYEKVVETGEPLPGNLPQNMLYLKATGLDETRFLYVERNYLKAVEIVQPFDHDVWAKVEAWLAGVLAHWQAGTYPEHAEVWQPEGRCRTCQYFAVCRERTYAGRAGTGATA